MKKIIFSFALFVLCTAVFAQDAKFVEKIKILETGTAVLSNGKCIIELSESVAPETYYVLITPMGAYSNLYLEKKENKSFVVKSDSETNAEFQYIVIEKRRKEILDPGTLKTGN